MKGLTKHCLRQTSGPAAIFEACIDSCVADKPGKSPITTDFTIDNMVDSEEEEILEVSNDILDFDTDSG